MDANTWRMDDLSTIFFNYDMLTFWISNAFHEFPFTLVISHGQQQLCRIWRNMFAFISTMKHPHSSEVVVALVDMQGKIHVPACLVSSVPWVFETPTWVRGGKRLECRSLSFFSDHILNTLRTLSSRTPHICAMQQDDSQDLEAVEAMLYDVAGVSPLWHWVI